MDLRAFSCLLFLLMSVFCWQHESRADELICRDIPSDLAKVEVDGFDGGRQINVFFPKKYQSFRFEGVELKLHRKLSNCNQCLQLVVATKLRVDKHGNYYRVSLLAGTEKENQIELKALYSGGCTSKMILSL